MKVDFYKEFKLEHPLVGLVERITSPKGVRHTEKDGVVSYSLYSSLETIYDDKQENYHPGLYNVLDVYKTEQTDELHWNHYLFIIDDDQVYPIAEFLDWNDSSWVKQALPYVKRYFSGEEQDPISLTRIKHKKSPVKTGWDKFKK